MNPTPLEAQHPHAYSRLASLRAVLAGKGFETRLTESSLVVLAPADHGPRPADTITCRERPDDGGKLWFFTSWNAPISEADHTTDAAVVIAGNLRPAP